MGDFAKAISVLRSQGIRVTVEDFIYPTQVAHIEGSDISGVITKGIKSVTFDEEELSVIRELLSSIACGYSRVDHFHHCCDANEIIATIDEKLQKE